jgi:hypothetical protein
MPPRKHHRRVRPRKKGAIVPQQKCTTNTGHSKSVATDGASGVSDDWAQEKENNDEPVKEDMAPSPLTDDKMNIKEMLDEAIQHAFADSDAVMSIKGREQANMDLDIDIDIDIDIEVDLDAAVDADNDRAIQEEVKNQSQLAHRKENKVKQKELLDD